MFGEYNCTVDIEGNYKRETKQKYDSELFKPYNNDLKHNFICLFLYYKLLSSYFNNPNIVMAIE